MDDKISDKDRIAWKKFIDGNEKLPNKDFALKKKISKIRQIDLHGYTLKKANKTVQEYIEKAFENLLPGKRRNYLHQIASAKTETTRTKRVLKLLKDLGIQNVG